jgi:hypothetical protein
MSVVTRIGAALTGLRRTPEGKREVKRDYSFQDWIGLWQQGWQQPPGQWPGYNLTYGKDPAEPIANDFAGYVFGGMQSNGAVWALEQKRIQIFSQARFQFQQLRNGRPGKLFPKPNLSLLEHPWPGGTTSDLLARMLVDADMAGNAWLVAPQDEVIRLRPDWVEIVLAARMLPLGPDGESVQVGFKQAGILYYEDGIYSGTKPAVFVPGEYVHFAPTPDPLATYRGMSWLTPVIREIQADTQATKHKLKFFENAATPNLAVSLPKEITPAQFEAFVDAMDARHKGADHAYETLYTGGGADVTVVGANMQQLDFKVTQGAGETRLAAAAGVHPVIVGFSEGMQGSSLNAGNYNAAKRSTVDTTFRHLWQNASGSLEQLVSPPDDASRLWYDARDVPFLHEDQKDAADIQQLKATTITMYVREGFTPESAIAAVDADDRTLLVHTGLVSVQLQPPGAGQPPAANGRAARSRSLQRKFDPTEPRDPHSGKWSRVGAAIGAVKDGLKIADTIPLGDGETFEGSSRVSLPLADVRMALTRAADGSPSMRFGVAAELPSKWHGANGGYTIKLDRRGIDELAAKTDELAKTTQQAERDLDAQWSRIEARAAKVGADLSKGRTPGEADFGDAELDRLVNEYDASTDQVIDEGTINSPWGQLYYQVVTADFSAKTSLLVTKPGAKLTGEDALSDLRGYGDSADFTPSDMRKLAAAVAKMREAARPVNSNAE